VILLLIALRARRYPGERALLAVIARRRPRRRVAVAPRGYRASAVEAGHAPSDRLLGEWSAANFEELGAEHVPLMAPPGPNGATPRELARRSNCGEHRVQRLLGDLAELGYLEEETPAGGGEAKVWLTADGFALAHMAERAVLAAFSARNAGDRAASAQR